MNWFTKITRQIEEEGDNKMKFPPIRQKLQDNPVILGLGIIVILLFTLLLHEYLLDNLTVIFEPGSSRYDDFRIAVIHCILAGYLPAAYFYLIRGTRNNIDELEKVLEPINVPSPINIGKRSLILWGLVGMMGAVFATYLTASSFWDPSTWNPEVWWHRGLGLFVGFWIGCFIVAVLDSSERVSRLADRIKKVDILDLSPLSPFVNQGLLTILLMIGFVSIFSLFLLEPRQWPAVVILVSLTLPTALLGLMQPVRGVHRLIREAKQAELQWTREKIRQAIPLLHDISSEGSSSQMGDLEAYRRLIEDVPEWPFQSSTILKVVLYLLIPIASWFGGMLIEGMVELVWGISR
ncbi:MAG: hypothetical protein C5S44_12160 [Candidatus Methanocomedens sp.]|nr:MAG: hypothetical protein C5S44_12160 [ANME-2 cluster archaeon]